MSEDRPPHWSREFLKPVNFVTTVMGVLGVIGVVFGFYAYHQTANRPELSWSSLKQIVFDQHNATSAVTLLDAQGQKIAENTYASQITVWNSGNERLDNVDDSTLIREPLTFRLIGAGRIVSATITNTLHDTAGGWSLKADQSTAMMGWRHFDPGAAARILILYSGDGSSNIELEISLAGANVLRAVHPPPVRTRRETAVVVVNVISICGLAFILVLPFSYHMVQRWRRLQHARLADQSAGSPNYPSLFHVADRRLFVVCAIVTFAAVSGEAGAIILSLPIFPN